MPQIFTTLGLDYDDRVLPSITNEVLKAVVAQFDAGELITQREMVSARVNSELTKRAEQVRLTIQKQFFYDNAVVCLWVFLLSLNSTTVTLLCMQLRKGLLSYRGPFRAMYVTELVVTRKPRT